MKHVKIMKIINYKKKKTNIYEITLSNSEKISLYDDVILKYDLLLKKELNDKLKMKIYEENSYLESYYKALKYLNIKLRTEKDIRKKLSEYNNKIIDYTIDRLYKEGYINNNSYINEIKYPLFEKEGIKYNNLYATYVLGPILVRNPEFLKYFLNNLTGKKLKYDLKLEIKAYNEFVKNFKENIYE